MHAALVGTKQWLLWTELQGVTVIYEVVLMRLYKESVGSCYSSIWLHQLDQGRVTAKVLLSPGSVQHGGWDIHVS